MVNSPASTLLLYIFDVKGSVLSLLPMIWAVEAVGIGAISSELRTPTINFRMYMQGRGAGEWKIRFRMYKGRKHEKVVQGDI